MKNVARWRKTSFVLKSATAMKFTVLERSPAVHFENKHRAQTFIQGIFEASIYTATVCWRFKHVEFKTT